MIENFRNFVTFVNDDDPLKVLMVGETYCDEHFRIVRECSDLNALEFIISGSGTLDIEGQHLSPDSDDIFFLKVGTKHEYRADPHTPWHKYWIVFEGPLADTLINCYLPKDTYLFENCNVKKYFEEIFEISREDIPYDAMVSKITVCLMHIFMYIRNRVQFDNEDLSDVIRRKLDEAVESEFNLEKLCKEINYSKNYIINVFKNKYKMTPYQYFLERKIDTAKAYLVHTNMSVGDIAKKLHYSDQQYFSSCFRQTVGVSPLEYRRKTRK